MELEISTTPYLRSPEDTPWLMYQVIFSTLPAIGAAYYFFGLAALAITATCVMACLITERLFQNQQENSTLADGSAIITGILLALTLPPGFPLWMAFLGGVFAVGVGKSIWGGLGQNIFNPSLVGRAFLQAAFPTAITTWSPPDGRYFAWRGTNLALPFLQGQNIDTVTEATPLALLKFQHQHTDFWRLLWGNTGGSLGETCGIALILGGLYLLWKNAINWRIPLSIFLTASIFSEGLYLWNPAIYPSPIFTLLSGGMLLGAIFMATDPVTSPLTPKGCWIFGAGIGFLVVLIRVFGGLPEGMMYAILLMNGVTPLINRWTPSRVYGT
ncbi:MAG: RnfABCDGE type electron transport complex subunit D [Planctomycetota bacterium]|nr:MAG: RnfABCDGE type electron transport complex subunit D [Planctomycetota bacterium]